MSVQCRKTMPQVGHATANTYAMTMQANKFRCTRPSPRTSQFMIGCILSLRADGFHSDATLTSAGELLVIRK
jgi:hypothetical protein